MEARATGVEQTLREFVRGRIKSYAGKDLSEEIYGHRGKGGIDIASRALKGTGHAMDEIADEAIAAGLLKPDPTKSNDMNLRDALVAAPSKAQLSLEQKQQVEHEQEIIEEGKEAERLAPERAKEFTAAQTRLKTTGEDIANPMMDVDDKFTIEGKKYKITARDEQGFRAEGETVFWIPYKQTEKGVGIYI